MLKVKSKTKTKYYKNYQTQNIEFALFIKSV